VAKFLGKKCVSGYYFCADKLRKSVATNCGFDVALALLWLAFAVLPYLVGQSLSSIRCSFVFRNG
jgi:hypothetical protein